MIRVAIIGVIIQRNDAITYFTCSSISRYWELFFQNRSGELFPAIAASMLVKFKSVIEIFWDEDFMVRNMVKKGQSWCSAVICRRRSYRRAYLFQVPKAVFTQYWIAFAKKHTRRGFCLQIRKLILARFCDGEKLPRRSRKCSVKYRIGSVLACSRSDSWARAKNWGGKKRGETREGYCSHPRDNELCPFSLVSPQSPLVFPACDLARFPPSQLRALLSERLEQDGTVPNFGAVQCEQLWIRTVGSE